MTRHQHTCPADSYESYQRYKQEKGHNQKVATTVERLRVKGARVRVKRRKLAHRKKTYLHIVAGGNHSTFFGAVLPAIREGFPEAYMTSGGFMSCSEETMNITVSLDPR